MSDPREEVWQSWADPNSLLVYLRQLRADQSATGRRKLRLFAIACCRRGWDILQQQPALRENIQYAEAFADGFAEGQGTKRELLRTQGDCFAWHESFARKLGPDAPLTHLALAAASASRPTPEPWNFRLCEHVGIALGNDPAFDYPAQSALLRCIFGNPFRPVTFDPRWRSETVVALAAGIYDARAFDRLPILADALEEAGCDQPDVLAHCRQPDGLHARGCWVVDGVLGKA